MTMLECKWLAIAREDRSVGTDELDVPNPKDELLAGRATMLAIAGLAERSHEEIDRQMVHYRFNDGRAWSLSEIHFRYRAALGLLIRERGPKGGRLGDSDLLAGLSFWVM
jgi:hypothetical protein